MTTDTQKIALVTGASRGLGAAMAEALGARGYHVIAVARTTGALEELDDRIRAAGGGPATLAPMDIIESPAMMQLAGAIAGRWGGIDVWVHTAIHAAPLTPAGHVDGKDWAAETEDGAGLDVEAIVEVTGLSGGSRLQVRPRR